MYMLSSEFLKESSMVLGLSAKLWKSWAIKAIYPSANTLVQSETTNQIYNT